MTVFYLAGMCIPAGLRSCSHCLAIDGESIPAIIFRPESLFIHKDLESGIGIVSVFRYIQPFAFFVFADPQPDGLFYDREGQQAQNKCPGTVGNDSEELDPQGVKSAAVKQSAAGGSGFQNGFRAEKAACQSSPYAIEQMNADRSDGVIDADAVDEQDTQNDEYACDPANDQSADRGNDVTGRGDCHQSCKSAVQSH